MLVSYLAQPMPEEAAVSSSKEKMPVFTKINPSWPTPLCFLKVLICTAVSCMSCLQSAGCRAAPRAGTVCVISFENRGEEPAALKSSASCLPGACFFCCCSCCCFLKYFLYSCNLWGGKHQHQLLLSQDGSGV